MKNLNFEDLNVRELEAPDLRQTVGGMWIAGAIIGAAALSFQLYKFAFDLGREYARNH